MLAAFLAAAAAEPLIEVVEPLRSAPLHHFLSWESSLFTAEAALREDLEVQLHEESSKLRDLLFNAQPKIWASASISDLRTQVNLSRWPSGQVVLEKAMAPESLQDVGAVLTVMQGLYQTFEEDFKDMKTSLQALRQEMDSQAHHFAVNLEIVLKQARVLLGLLRGLPDFSECLFQSLAEARERRPPGASYAQGLLYLQSLASGAAKGKLCDGPGDASGCLRVRASTFSGEAYDAGGSLGSKLKELLERSRTMLRRVQASELSKKEALDWCAGTQQLWTVDGPNPCSILVRGFEELIGWLAKWLQQGEAEKLLRHMRRRQFAAAPNISRVEVLSELLLRSAEICDVKTRSVSTLPPILKTIAEEEQANLEHEQELLAEVVTAQFPDASQESDLLRPGLLGLARCCVTAQWIFETGLLAASAWADRVKRRGNGLQNRLNKVKQSFQALHEQLQALPTFRRLAFEEIHAAGHWGRGLSGGGSNAEVTKPLARHLLKFLKEQGAESLIDIGCGWGEWIPLALREGVSASELPQSFRYLGVDIAWQPIKHLQRLHEAQLHAPKLEFQVLDGVSEELPKGYHVALVRYVFQHLNIRDALSLLRNLRSVDYVVLSSWPGSSNSDLEDFGGSSAYAAMEPSTLSRFESYDLRRAPFDLPEPLSWWPEMNTGRVMLAYHTSSLERL